MAKKKGNALTPKEREQRLELTIKKLELAKTCGLAAIIAGGIVGLAYVGIALPVAYSAGKETTINYAMTWMQSIRADIWVSWALTAGTGAWAIQERRKRLRERKEKDERNAKLEQKIDPQRSSSGLNVEGTHHRETKK